MWAVQTGHSKTTQMLIDAGANINFQDTHDSTALNDAARNGHTETVEVLIAAGASIDLPDSDGHTALMLAAYKGHTDVAKNADCCRGKYRFA